MDGTYLVPGALLSSEVNLHILFYFSFCRFLKELQIHWDQTPLKLSTVQEGNNITLQWRFSYTLGLPPSFREAAFFDLRDGEEKRIANKSGQNDLYVEPAYQDRVGIHIENTKATMTILTALRSDSGRYKFEVETLNYNKPGGLTSIIEISVQCK